MEPIHKFWSLFAGFYYKEVFIHIIQVKKKKGMKILCINIAKAQLVFSMYIKQCILKHITVTQEKKMTMTMISLHKMRIVDRLN